MKIFRKKRTLRWFCALMFLSFMINVVSPTVSYALTSGPHQPEYTSYEDASSSDMVNLLTGDFTFTMPILSVPVGNEGSFAVPLSYHAGISPHQEASFVGLGFNINVGSITRNINGFPDDANGETQTINVKDLTGRRGWYSNFMGWSMGWDSQAGHYGVISLGSLSANWDGDGSTVGLGGVYVGKDGRVEPVEVGMTILRVAAAIASYGTSEFAAGIAMDVQSAAMQQAAIAASFQKPQSPGAVGNWQYSSKVDKKVLGLYKNYWYWLDQTRIEDMYGTLYLDKPTSTPLPEHIGFATLKMKINGISQTPMQFPKSDNFTTKGAASDVNINISSADNYGNVASPSLLANDNYQVNGPGISGSITPYRLEVGSVSVPREMTTRHIRLNPVPFLDYGSNKVPFIYEGTHENRYYHHVGASSSISSPTFYYGLNSVRENSSSIYNPDKDIVRYDLDDVIFNNSQRIGSAASTHKKLPQGAFIDWLKNSEIKSSTGKFANTSYMDYFPLSTREAFRSNYNFGGRTVIYGVSATGGSTTSTIQLSSGQNVSNVLDGQLVDVNVVTYYFDNEGNVLHMSTTTHTNVQINSVSGSQIVLNKNGISVNSGAGHVEIVSRNQPKQDHIIGGFVVTSADGMNYHYSIPIYDYGFKTQTIDKSDANKNSFIARPGQFANTWLLTAITGPDFVDRGGSGNQGDGYIDENDWGYWIKFNYGSHLTDYKWSSPYSTNGSGTTTMTSDNNYKVYAEGLKEKYYINSIETRSHVAIFIKDSRRDAKDASAAKKPSLRLSEIALLTKESYRQLTNSSTAAPNRLSDCSGKINVLYQVSSSNSDNNITGTKAAFIHSNAIRRIVFNNNDYTLCSGATNSDAGYGKLTLKSISIYGRNNSKVLPDYKFSYGNNPSFHPDKWDGWGMYSGSATSAGHTHKASATDSNGAAWSLTEITNPLGSKILVSYQRDTYASISGDRTVGSTYGFGSTNNFYFPSEFPDVRKLYIGSSTNFTINEKVKVSGQITYTCPDNSVRYTSYSKGEMKIVEVGSNYIRFEDPYVTLSECNVANSGTSIQVSNSGSVQKYINKPGGNVRVSSIELVDPNGQSYKTRYLYNKADGTSSGVVAQEPDYIRTSENDYDFYKWLDYPATPVLYGEVTVLTGRLTNDSDYSTRTVYEFETPHRSQYAVNPSPTVKLNEVVGFHQPDLEEVYHDQATLNKFEIENRTSRIGKLVSVKVYDKTGIQYSSHDYEYTDVIPNGNANNYQGVFSEGTLIHELIETWDGAYDSYRLHKIQRTSVLKYPWTLKKVISTVDGHTYETTNNSWDLFSGAIVESAVKSPLNITTKTVIDPLYRVNGTGYSEFGSKAENPSNLNMLTQVGATYVYRLDNAGRESGLVGASAVRWKKDWLYRTLDINNNYVDDPETSGRQVWRKHESFVWKGNYSGMNPDGTHKFTSADKFNFGSSLNPKWQSVGAFERFGHNSVVLETKDMNQIYSSTKLGYNDALILASAVNARSNEIAFSSAEDKINSLYFGGEVGIGSGEPVTTAYHSGSTAIRLTSGYSFIFKSVNLSSGKKYRSSVWTNSENGRIYYKINGGTETLSDAPTTQKKVGNWYLLDCEIPAQSSSFSIEVGVKNGSPSTAILFDDFRFQPAQSAMTCYVYDSVTGQVTHVLDNDNLFVKYEYNDRGLLIRTSRESIQYQGVKLISESNSDFKRFHVDQ